MADKYIYRRESEFSNYSNHPSFSSTLLDAIYRSIDQGEEEEIVTYREPMRTKCGDANVRTVLNKSIEEDMATNYRRACMVEKWMEKKVIENAVVRRKSVTDKYRQDSISSSSDSSCGGAGGFFSPSETESFPVQMPKPVRTGGSKEKFGDNRRDRRDFADQSGEKSKNGGGFSKTKSRALKFYGDLKKVKQAPISPGGKLAGFLNSLFTAGNSKKPNKIGGDDDSPSLKSTKTTSCSSASSFSRSCLVKTPSSGGKSSGGEKRSVKFFPVDEDCHRSIHHENNNSYESMKTAIDEELLAHIMEKNRRVEEAARYFLMNYQKKIEIGNLGFDQNFIEEEDDDFDAASYASSDLFELENLSAIGMERYKQELPVYETTHLHDNIAIANGLIL